MTTTNFLKKKDLLEILLGCACKKITNENLVHDALNGKIKSIHMDLEYTNNLQLLGKNPTH